jgi:adenylate cyclase
MAWPRGLREVAIALAAAAAARLLLRAAGGTGLLRDLETASLDMRFRVRGRLPPSPDLAVVLADDRSLEKLGRWPFSRRLFAASIDRANRAGAKLIVFDLLFAEPEQPVSKEIRALAREAAAMTAQQDRKLADQLQRIADDDPDQEFAAAIEKAGNVLLPIAFGFDRPADAASAALSAAAFASFDKSTADFSFALHPTSVLLPLERLAQSAAGLGHVNIAYDRSGAVRYDYLALPYDVDFYPSMAVRAAAAYRGLKWNDVGLRLGQGIRLGTDLVPTDSAMRLIINYRGPRGAIPTYSFTDLIDGKLPDSALRNRIVLIGASFVGNADSFVAPFTAAPMPGTERLANAIDTLLQRDFIIENPPGWSVLIGAAALLGAMLTGCAAGLLSLWAAVATSSAAALALAAAAQAAFDRGLWLPLVQPLAALLCGSAAALLYRYWFVDRQRQQVRSAFAHYMAPDLVEILATHPERLKLGGETRPMTLLFCDIRGFTSISERFKASPEALTQLINRFLTPMTDVIMAQRGTIDKYMGDCIMAFWNAPLDDRAHADHACAAALAMRAELDRLNESLAKEAEAAGTAPVRLAIGIGINSGDCVVGNMGSERRFDYSVMGDAVNLASRLEGQSKLYGVTLVIGETTRALAPSWAAVELDLIAVKGKQEAVRIFTLLGDEAVARSSHFRAFCSRHDDMLSCYRARSWQQALALIEQCRPYDARLAGLYDLYDQRIAGFLAAPPEPDWKGVYVALSK